MPFAPQPARGESRQCGAQSQARHARAGKQGGGRVEELVGAERRVIERETADEPCAIGGAPLIIECGVRVKV
jgi:hypothetical protein